MNNAVLWNDRGIVPSKVVCVGRNYVAHIHELNNPIPDELVLFLKPNSAISDTLRCPPEACRYETELTFLVQGGVPVAVGVGLDLTKVEVQKRLKAKGLPWEKSKAFDNSAIFTKFVDVPATLDALWLRLSVNGETRQEGGVSLMIHQPDAIFAEVAHHFSLNDGDLVMTGTPEGVGALVAGDRFEVELWDGEEQRLAQTWIVT